MRSSKKANAAQSPLTDEITKKVMDLYTDDTSCDSADALIIEYNKILEAQGMPIGRLFISKTAHIAREAASKAKLSEAAEYIKALQAKNQK